MAKSTWMLIAVYILFIYSTLPVARWILNFLYDSIGSSYLNIIVNTILLLSLIYISKVLYTKKGYLALIYSFGLLLFLVIIAYNMERPEERIHFIEYGALGFLFLKAFGKVHISNLILSFCMVTVVGAVDELIQWILPNRVGDIKDVAMNSLGGLIGIWFGRLYYSS